MRLFVYSLFAVLLLSAVVRADETPRAGSSDSRVLLAMYRDSEVYKVVATYGFQTTIEFSDKETVETISIGDSIAWQVVPAGHRVFLKPQEQNAVTNMTVITSMRPYYFELGARKSSNPASVTFLLRFTYPDLSPTVLDVRSASRTSVIPAKKPSDYNFNYSLTGSKEIAPTRVFDDGEFTFMQFRGLADLPAIFLVDKDKQESVINYRIEGPYVVIERIGKQFSLRHGSDIACVYNGGAGATPAVAANSDRPNGRATKAVSP